MTEKLTVPLAQEMRNLLDSLVEEESDFDGIMDDYEDVALDPLPYIDDDQIDQGNMLTPPIDILENFREDLYLWVKGFKDHVEQYGQSIEYNDMLSIIANKISNNYEVHYNGPPLKELLPVVISPLYK
jgi:hypothetical protein|tara:strand:+ start:141 stop:524 length:384 start_codon:yes stop_codon:yes gene_type:complete